MTTIKDVARMAGVSPSTVSKYLNGGHVRPECADPIRNAISVLDYRVNPFARNLKSQRVHSVGILMPDMTAPFFGTVLMALDKTLRENGYQTLICFYGSNYGLERDKLRFLINNGIEGLIYIPGDLSGDEFQELTSLPGIPTVLIDRAIPGVDSDAVLVNNADAVYQAVSLLIRKGHRRTAIISGPKSVFTSKERVAGYLRALSDHGVLYDEQLVITEENDFGTGYRGCETLLNLPDPPSAIIATNYNITTGVLTAARERGIHVGEDLAILGFDCVEICSMMKPPLPVIHQPEQAIGQTAAKYLIQRLDGYTGPPRITQLNCDLSSPNHV